MNNFNHIPVNSSNIHSIGYHPESKCMQVTFKGGSTYEYPNIESEHFEEFKISPSKGKHFASRFRHLKTFRKL